MSLVIGEIMMETNESVNTSNQSCKSSTNTSLASLTSLTSENNGSNYSWFRRDPYFAAFSQRSLLQQIMHHEQEPNNIRQSFNPRLLRLVGTSDPFKLFLDLEQMKKQWFYAQDTRQISKRKKFFQYIVDNHLLEDLYPKLAGQIDLIRLIVQVYRQIQQEAFGIVLINRKHQVFLVQNEKYYWSFPKGKLKLNPDTYRFESQWSCALREFYEEVNVDLSDWIPSQYWETRMADQRMVGLFVIENFDESKVQFEFDKREIIDIMWFSVSNNHDQAHDLRQYWKEQQRLSDPYYTALPFIEHLIFEYLPHKQQLESVCEVEDEWNSCASSCASSSSPVMEASVPSSTECSIIDMLLGRIPVRKSVTSVESCRLDQDEPCLGCCSSLSNDESHSTAKSILDRLNEAIGRAMCMNEQEQAQTNEHRIAVQA